MKRQTTLVLAGAVLLAVTIAAPACGGSDSPPDEDAEVSWVELLARVPDTEETRSWVQMNNHARARQAYDVERPGPDADEEALREYFMQLVFEEEGDGRLPLGGVLGTWAFPSRNGASPEDPSGGAFTELRRELGFTVADVDQDIQAGETYQIVRGSFDPQAVDEAVRSDPAFSDLLEEGSHLGIPYYSWGEDSTPDPGRVTAVRPDGMGHRLALHEEYLYWAQSTEDLEAMIETGLGQRQSLADVEEFRLRAEGLDALGAYTAVFTDGADRFSVANAARLRVGLDATEEALEAVREQLRTEPLLLPFEDFATGRGVDDEGPYVAVVVLNHDEETAVLNAERLEERLTEASFLLGAEPWSELVPHFDISSEGRLVLAKLYTDRGSLWMRISMGTYPLLLYE